MSGPSLAPSNSQDTPSEHVEMINADGVKDGPGSKTLGSEVQGLSPKLQPRSGYSWGTKHSYISGLWNPPLSRNGKQRPKTEATTVIAAGRVGGKGN